MTLAKVPTGPTYVIQATLNHHSRETPKCHQIVKKTKVYKNAKGKALGSPSLQNKGLHYNKMICMLIMDEFYALRVRKSYVPCVLEESCTGTLGKTLFFSRSMLTGIQKYIYAFVVKLSFDSDSVRSRCHQSKSEKMF